MRKGAAAKQKTKSNLAVNVYREFFDLIRIGKKKEENREVTDYWRRRLEGRKYEEVHFRNGYLANAPFMRVEWKGVRTIRLNGRRLYAIKLGRVLQVKDKKK